MPTSQPLRVSSLSYCLLLLIFGTAQAEPLAFSGSGVRGHFEGLFQCTAASSTEATITLELTNTSPFANGGFLTAFVFNNPDNRITGASLTASDSDFEILGLPSLSNSLDGSPFGTFDLGASISSSFGGGGPPSEGTGVNDTGLFVFALTGTLLSTLTEEHFFNELSVPPGDGKGTEAFVARFRGFQDEGGDKVPGFPKDPGGPTTLSTPEPSSLVLGCLGLGGMLGGYWRRFRQ